uniref:VWFA domain-containing protein n=1 Tax=Sinocyclocheilus anshuiensis TaxID=1608454 RepID=A0A671KRJ1_9TELE
HPPYFLMHIVFAILFGDTSYEIIQYIYCIFSLVWLLIKLKVSGFLLSVCTQNTVADIVFLVDGSNSIGRANFQQIREFLSSLVENFEVAPDRIRIGLVQYSDTPYTEFSLSTYQNKEEILRYIQNLRYITGETFTGKGLEFMLKQHFVEKAGSRAQQNVPQIAIVITDGDSQDEVESQAQELRQRGIKMFAIGIKDANETLLRQIASEPYDQHAYSVSDFAALQGISQSVIRKVCTAVEETQKEVILMSKVLISCDSGRCSKSYIVLLVDSSGSIGDSHFKEVREFLHSFVDSFNLRPDKVRVGLAQYSDMPHKEFLLGDYSDKTDLHQKLTDLIYRGGSTNTGLALTFIRENYFTLARQNVPGIAIVITDGESNDDVEEPSQRLRNLGVSIFVIRVGTGNMEKLRTIANIPHEEFLFSIDSYQELQVLKESLRNKVCFTVTVQSQGCKQTTKADIYFLLDESGSINSNEFDDMKNFTKQLLEAFEVGNNHVRFGLVKFASSATIVFRIHYYNTKADIEKAVTSLRNMGGGTRTDLGLREMIPLFEEAVRTRGEKVRKLLIVITDGESIGTVESVEVPAKLLRTEQNVIIYAIGVKDASEPELELISGSPQRTFYVKNYDFLDEIKKDIITEIFDGKPLEKNVSSQCLLSLRASTCKCTPKSANIYNSLYSP